MRQAVGKPVGQRQRRGLVGLGFVSPVPRLFSTCASKFAGERNPSGFV